MGFIHVTLVGEKAVCFESSKAQVTFHKSQTFILIQFEICFTLAHKCAAIFVAMQAKFVTFQFFSFFASKVTSWTFNLAVNFSKMPLMFI